MKRFSWYCGLALPLLAIAALYCLTLFQSASSGEKTAAPTARWEYKATYVNLFKDPEVGEKEVEKKLNALGEQGWELVSTVGAATDHYLILKRPKR